MPIDASLWSVPTTQLADRLYQSLEKGDKADEWLHWLLHGFENRPTRVAARKLITEIGNRRKADSWPFKRLFVKEIYVSWAGQPQSVLLLLTDSVFEPEDWSRTFLEGCLRRPASGWKDAEAIEVGTGTGWVTIMLCKFHRLRRVLALDLNPHSVLVAKINVYISSMTDTGDIAVDGSGTRRPLFEYVDVHESDLLKHAIGKGEKVDVIFGCIPQVLEPPSTGRERDSIQALYDLGNYCAVQGLMEDSFGLGLNAAAIDQSLGVLKDGGCIVLNLAGRPGKRAVATMFTRRGLTAKTLWRTRIVQAGDTSVDPLVELEKVAQTDFEFYMHRESIGSIPARTAAEIVRRGGSVWHELRVIEAQPALGELSRKLVQSLRSVGTEDSNRELDLKDVDEEQAQFVISLAQHFSSDKTWSLPERGGNVDFRKKVSAYLSRYGGVEVGAQDIYVGGDRRSTYRSLCLALTEAGNIWVVSKSMCTLLEPVARQLDCTIVPGPSSIGEIAELVAVVKPNLVIVGIENESSLSELGELLTRLAESNTAVIIDNTEKFEITSRATGGGVFGRLRGHPHAHWPVYVVGLEKSRVYPGLNVTFVIHPDPRLHTNMCAASDATSSRTGWFEQRYYDYLFGDMTMYRMWGDESGNRPKGLESSGALPSGRMQGACLHTPDPMPSDLPSHVIQHFVTAFLSRSAGGHDPEMAKTLEKSIISQISRGWEGVAVPAHVVLHTSVVEALYDAILSARKMRYASRARILTGKVAGLLHDVECTGCAVVMTTDGVKVTPKDLERQSASGAVDVVYLSSAGDYSDQETSALMKWAEANGAWIFMEGQTRMCTASPGCVTVSFNDFGATHGISGLGIAFAVTSNARLARELQRARLTNVPNYAMHVAAQLMYPTASALAMSRLLDDADDQ